jgi:hypothetical protein
MFTIETNVPAPTPKIARIAAIVDGLKNLKVVTPGEEPECLRVLVAFRASAVNYAKRNGIKIVTKLDPEDKAYAHIWKVGA